MSLIDEIKNRGYFKQCTNINKLVALAEAKKLVTYIGFDCTAPSLHVGNLMPIMLLRLLQKHGNKPIIVIGGATTKIGDPSGKKSMRKILTQDEIDYNILGIKKSLAKFISFGDGPSDAVLVDNSDWIEKFSYIEFLRNYGKFVSVNRMLTMESVKSRLDSRNTITFLEFNYMLLQAIDFYHLYSNYDCIMQVGGSDQWGNIIMGVELIHKLTGQEVLGFTTPLLTTSSGAKMGKSASGAVWLNEELLSPYDYFQYWRNVEDRDTVKFAKLYTEWSDDEINDFAILVKNNINEAKKKLACRLTCLCHGIEKGQEAAEASKRIFEENSVSQSLPQVILESKTLNQGITAYTLFYTAGLASSKSEARNLIRGGGARINNVRIDDENTLIDFSYLDNGCIKLTAGKKKHALVKLSN